eukprot:194917_1
MDTILTLDRLFHFKVKLLVLCHVIGLSTSYFFSNWIAPPQPLLPRPVYAMAICHLNNSIILLGGGENDFQMVFYNISNNSITDYGTLPHDMSGFGHGDYYTQINHMFYWIEPITSNIIEYNIINNTLKANIIMETFVSSGACLTSINNTLFVLGGLSQTYDRLNSTQIFDLSNHTWLDSLQIPEMIFARSHHTCVVDPLRNQLYAIGGDLGSPAGISDVVEVISIDNIDNISNQIWRFSDNLTYPTMSARAVIYHDKILIIGGLYTKEQSTSVDMLSEIQVIDCNTGSVSTGGHLNYGVATTSIVIVNDIIYAFGGSNNIIPPSGVNTWQYSRADLTDHKHNGAPVSQIVYIVIGASVLLFCICVIGMCWIQKRRVRNVSVDSNSMRSNEFSELHGK